MRSLRNVQQHYKIGKKSWVKEIAGILFLALLLFAGPTPQLHAETQGTWSTEEGENSYYYTDQNGWKYAFTKKEDESCKLKSIPSETEGEISFPGTVTIEGKERKLYIDYETVRIPKGVTKVTFSKDGTFYSAGSMFEESSPDLIVNLYLERSNGIFSFAKEKGFQMEYQNGYEDKQGVVYYTVGCKEKDYNDLYLQGKVDQLKGNKYAAVYAYVGSADTVKIASKVTIQGVKYNITDISGGVFSGKNIKKVTIPETVTGIGDEAFSFCEKLNNVKLPKKLNYLGWGVFRGCKSLTSIEIPSNVTRLYTETFGDCTNLKKVTLSKKMQSIGDYTFGNCKKLTTIKNLDQISSMGSEVFCNCKKLTSLTFGKKFSDIGMAVFYNCTNLKQVTFQSKKMNYIHSQTFYGTKRLKTVTIKATNLTSKNVASDAFMGSCKKLVVKVPAKKVKAYKKLFRKCGNKTIIVKKQ